MPSDRQKQRNQARIQREEERKIAHIAEQSLTFPSTLKANDLGSLPGSLPATGEYEPCIMLALFDFPSLPTISWSEETSIPTTSEEIRKALPIVHRTLGYAEREALAQDPRANGVLIHELRIGWLQYEPYAPGTAIFYSREDADAKNADEAESPFTIVHSFRSSFNARKIETLQEQVTVFNRARSIGFTMHEEAAKAVLEYTKSLPEGELLLKQIRNLSHTRLSTALREILIMTVEDPPPNQFLQPIFSRLGDVKGYRQRSPLFLLIKAALFIMDSLQYYPMSYWLTKMQDLEFCECCRRIMHEVVSSITATPTTSTTSVPIGTDDVVDYKTVSTTLTSTSISTTAITASTKLTPSPDPDDSFFLTKNLISHLEEAARLSFLLDKLFQTYKIEDRLDSYIITEERNRTIIAQQQKRSRINESNYLSFYLMQLQSHRIYSTPSDEEAYHFMPQKQFQTGFPYYKILVQQRMTNAAVQKLHGDTLYSGKAHKLDSVQFKMKPYRYRRRQGIPDAQMYHYISDIRVPPCYMRRLRSDPILSFVFRPLPRCQKELFYYRSSIHGFGLYLAEPAQRKDLVTEYAGDIISSLVADVREKLYTEAGLKSVYMFSIKSNCIIDTTLRGNFGRFLNHSCSPTAESLHAKYSVASGTLEPVYSVSQSQGIAISMVTKLSEGAEVTQNYYLSKEPADTKLFCECGSSHCRLYMN